jgi:hypothetical protein
LYVLPDGYIYGYIKIVPPFPEITIKSKTDGYFNYDPNNDVFQEISTEEWDGKLTNKIPVTAGDILTYKGKILYGTNRSVVWYDANNREVASEKIDSEKEPIEITAPEGAVYLVCNSHSMGEVILEVKWVKCQAVVPVYQWASTGHAFVPTDYEDRIIALEKNMTSNSGGVLFGKKYVACGDSFTAGDFASKTEETWSNTYGVYKTYPYWIASRNNMSLVNEAKGGSDFTNISGATNAFSVNRYKTIPTDADYITLMFGLNETGIGDDNTLIGTKEDTTNTTLWGAYNVVFEHLLTSIPYAKIGVILADAWMSENYANAVKEICKYWGIPCLDLKGENVPMGIGGQYTATSSKAKALRNAAFQISSDNSHPNVKAHEYRSTIIENFLRSL